MTDNQHDTTRAVHRAYEHSRVRRAASALRRLAANPEPAAVRRRRLAAGRTVRLAGQHALTARIARRCARSVQNARLYEWLTREPDPTVVEVDLTETWTVGPVIAVVDRLIERSGGVGSRATRVGDRVRRVPARRPVGVLGVVVAALIALVWWFLWSAGGPLVGLVAVGMLAVAALLCSSVTVSASALATPLSYRLVRGTLLPPAEPPDGGMSDDPSADRSSTRDSTDAVADTDDASRP